MINIWIIYYLLNVIFTDWSVALGHGPFSHMFDGKFLPSIGSETKVILLFLGRLSMILAFFKILISLVKMIIFNIDQTCIFSILSRMHLYRLKFRELLYACCNFAFNYSLKGLKRSLQFRFCFSMKTCL